MLLILILKKAFDSVPHERLLTKLEGYGVSGNILNWIRDFLSDRYQYVKINNSSSEKLPVTSGVPQGSVLGPTLFIYFINDLPSVTTALMKIFADDTKAHNKVLSTEDREFLQTAIDDMYSWTVEWMLGFNEDKCNILHLGKNNPHFNYNIGPPNNKVNLGTTVSEKDLGVYVHLLLNFENHVQQTTKKASRVSFQIIKKYLLQD